MSYVETLNIMGWNLNDKLKFEENRNKKLAVWRKNTLHKISLMPQFLNNEYKCFCFGFC